MRSLFKDGADLLRTPGFSQRIELAGGSQTQASVGEDTFDKDSLRGLLDAEWANFRYQDGLRWSRFQIVLIIQAALLAGSYSKAVDAGPILRILYAICLTFFTAVMCALAEKDGRDASQHGKRANKVEDLLGLPRFERAKWVAGLSGYRTTQLAMSVVLAMDVGLIANLSIRWWLFSQH